MDTIIVLIRQPQVIVPPPGRISRVVGLAQTTKLIALLGRTRAWRCGLITEQQPLLGALFLANWKLLHAQNSAVRLQFNKAT